MVVEVIVDPDSFFEKQSRSPSVAAPVLVVVLAALSTAIVPSIILYYIMNISPRGMSIYMLIFGITNVIGGILAIFGLWMVTSILLHFMAFYLSGNGGLRNTILMTGWGFLPMVFVNISNSFLTYRIISSIFSQVNIESISIAHINAMLANHPMMILTKLVSSLGVVWMGFLWTFAIRNVHDINFRNSTIVSSINILIIFVYWTIRLL